jgi:hypothetical protein
MTGPHHKSARIPEIIVMSTRFFHFILVGIYATIRRIAMMVNLIGCVGCTRVKDAQQIAVGRMYLFSRNDLNKK